MIPKSKALEKFLNALVLIGSIAIIVVISIELLSTQNVLSERFILHFHLLVCSIFLADFFVRLVYRRMEPTFLFQQPVFLIGFHPLSKHRPFPDDNDLSRLVVDTKTDTFGQRDIWSIAYRGMDEPQ